MSISEFTRGFMETERNIVPKTDDWWINVNSLPAFQHFMCLSAWAHHSELVCSWVVQDASLLRSLCQQLSFMPRMCVLQHTLSLPYWFFLHTHMPTFLDCLATVDKRLFLSCHIRSSGTLLLNTVFSCHVTLKPDHSPRCLLSLWYMM